MGCQADVTVVVDDVLFGHELPQGVVDGLGGQWQSAQFRQVVALAVAEQPMDLAFGYRLSLAVKTDVALSAVVGVGLAKVL